MRAVLVGFIAVAGIAIASPASAQGVYFGAPGVEVDIGGPRYRDDRPRYRAYEVEPRYQTYGYSVREPGCRTITIRRDDGSVKRIRRCD